MVQLTCPFCGFGRSWVVRRNKRKCRACRREFGRKSHLVSGFRLTKETWQKVIATFLRERTVRRIAEETGLGTKTAQRAAHHLRCVMATDVPLSFPGRVEMDETYIGGQRKNKHLHIRKIAAKKGHGTDKLPIVGLFSRVTGQVLVAVEPKKLDIAFIISLIQKHVPAGSKIYTDGFKMYRGLTRHGYEHAFVDHDGGEMVRGEIHTNNIEGFWGILKRKLGCIGGMRRTRLHYFVGEIVWKYNHRTQSLKEQERALLELVLRG